MSIPLFVSERSKPEMTTRPLSVGCLVFEWMDPIDFLDHLRFFRACRTQQFRSSGNTLNRCVTCGGFGSRRMCALRNREYSMFCSCPVESFLF